jgi:hypothetical protein
MNMKSSLVLGLISLTALLVLSGSGLEGIWIFGGSSLDHGSSVQQTTDGGYIIAGTTSSYGAGGNDIWLMKTDANGNEIWNKTFGGPAYECSGSVQQTADGGFIIIGDTHSYGSADLDIWLIKTDANGNEIWNKTFGGPAYDMSDSVQQTTDGGYIIAGTTSSYGAGGDDIWLIKTDANGNKIWSKTFGGAEDDSGRSVQPTADGGYIVAGFTHSYGAGSSCAFLIKTDADGNELWDKTFGGDTAGQSIQQTIDGGYVMTGSIGLNGTEGSDIWLIKTDANGKEIWERAFGVSGYDYVSAYSIQQTIDGGYIIPCWNSLIKTDSNGNELWDRTFGGGEIFMHDLEKTADGGYIITGNYRRNEAADVVLIKTDSNGDTHNFIMT